MENTDGVTRWANPCVIPGAKSFSGMGLATDIDERKPAEDRLRDTRVELNKAARIATLAELSASIAHELNQPLMSVFANAQAA
jgi:C4-dicarboxylate-specific signal transduction histidine kinase